MRPYNLNSLIPVTVLCMGQRNVNKPETQLPVKHPLKISNACGLSATASKINLNNVNTIFKKLGVNVPSSSSLSNTSSSGAKAVNKSLVKVNLSGLKGVNIDEMIDDDDDEERLLLIRDLEKNANKKEQIGDENIEGIRKSGHKMSKTGHRFFK